MRPEPHRVFPYGGVAFRYPRAFTFEASLDDADLRSWTLSGNDFKVMYFVFAVRVTAKSRRRVSARATAAVASSTGTRA